MPIVTDVHEASQAKLAGQVADCLQIPAFLCRQTDLLVACGKTGKPVNIKKGQFVSPGEMKNCVQKVRSTGNDKILSELLEIADNFERALQHSDGAEGANGAVTDGTRMIYGQLKTLLERHGVTPIESVGQRFDPNLHEALLQVASDEYDEGVVAQEVTRGYMIDDRVLRHARVAVSKGPEGKTGEENQG